MATAPTTELTLASRAGAYVALTKPDVSLLVLMTTGAGFYMGSRGPVDWLRLAHAVFGTMLIAAGAAAPNHYISGGWARDIPRAGSRALPGGGLKPDWGPGFWVGVGGPVGGGVWVAGGGVGPFL